MNKTVKKPAKLFIPIDKILLILACIVCTVFAYLLGTLSNSNNHKEIKTTIRKVSPTDKPQDAIVDQFINAKFRVIKVEKDPNVPYYVIVATERSQDMECGMRDTRCGNDTGCGSIYTSPHCYFFAEPDYMYGAIAKTRFLGQLDAGSGFFSTSTTFTYPDKSHIQFTIGDGDVTSFTKTWKLDVLSGGLEKISGQHFSQ